MKVKKIEENLMSYVRETDIYLLVKIVIAAVQHDCIVVLLG